MSTRRVGLPVLVVGISVFPAALFGTGSQLSGGGVEAPRISISGENKEQNVQQRIKELITAFVPAPFETPEQKGKRLTAIEELVKLGDVAVPQLVVAATGKDRERGVQAVAVLDRIGKPALPHIKQKWGSLTDPQRWRLMPLREKYDLDEVREYVRNCLDLDSDLGASAWHLTLRTKDEACKEKYYTLLAGEGAETVRWSILPGAKPAYDEAEENRLMIALLKPGSWLAEGKGRPIPGEIGIPDWPDGRSLVVRTLQTRKVTAAAPQLLALLKEAGPGHAFHAETVIPALVELGYKPAIEELERIVAQKVEKPKAIHPHATVSHQAVKELAADAIRKLRAAKDQ